ncbi:MAG: hypothetical protein H7301_09030 [Cryobacterium sp.]|nr:hypothetical protein [Oligoflexia bacterium]
MKNRSSALLAILAISVLCSCTDETVGDTTQRERERQRQVGQQAQTDQLPVLGNYVGKVNGSDVALFIDSTESNVNGELAPKPTLSGILTISPKLMVSRSDRLRIPFQLSDGVYDGSRELSFTVNANGTKLSCSRVGTDSLDCDWHLYYVSRITFKRVSAAPDVTSGPKGTSDISGLKTLEYNRAFKGKYQGHSIDHQYSVGATFSAAIATNGGAAGTPPVSIVGVFTFAPVSDSYGTKVSYSFTDGAYDISTDTLAASIPGDNGTILINCKNDQNGVLHCSWNGRNVIEFDLAAIGGIPKIKGMTHRKKR